LSPSLDANASGIRQRFSANGYFPAPIGGGTYTVYQGTLDFHYEFDFWNKNRDALDAALSAASAAQADAAAARLVLASGIASTYFQLRYALEQSAITHEALDRRQQLLKLTQDRTATGLESEVSVRQAQAEVEQAQVDIIGADRTVKLLRNQLAALLGAGPQATADTGQPAGNATHTAALPRVVPADLLGRRPDIAASRARVEAAAARIGVAKADFMPNINLAASLGLQSIDLGTLLTGNSRLFSFGPALSLPIFEGGRLRANLKASDAEYDVAVEQYNQAVIDAVHEAADAIANYQHATRALAPEDAAVDATRQAYDLTLSRYKSGLNNYLSVLIAENKLLDRRSARAQLAARQAAGLIDIYKALGGGYTAPTVATAR
jgi:NodT family efflux transporter outer membrane factor (OMF) lipoprotein